MPQMSITPLGGRGLRNVDVQVQRQRVLGIRRQRSVDQLLRMACGLLQLVALLKSPSRAQTGVFLPWQDFYGDDGCETPERFTLSSGWLPHNTKSGRTWHHVTAHVAQCLWKTDP